jgi:hypothetical protein
VELHGPLIAGSIVGQPLSGIFTRTCRLRAAPVLWPRHSPTFPRRLTRIVPRRSVCAKTIGRERTADASYPHQNDAAMTT